MRTNWESKEERLKRFMKISAKQKLDWLEEMNAFNAKLPRRILQLRKKLRRLRTQSQV